jgi:hypothetical protein
MNRVRGATGLGISDLDKRIRLDLRAQGKPINAHINGVLPRLRVTTCAGVLYSAVNVARMGKRRGLISIAFL